MSKQNKNYDENGSQVAPDPYGSVAFLRSIGRDTDADGLAEALDRLGAADAPAFLDRMPSAGAHPEDLTDADHVLATDCWPDRAAVANTLETLGALLSADGAGRAGHFGVGHFADTWYQDPRVGYVNSRHVSASSVAEVRGLHGYSERRSPRGPTPTSAPSRASRSGSPPGPPSRASSWTRRAPAGPRSTSTRSGRSIRR